MRIGKKMKIIKRSMMIEWVNSVEKKEIIREYECTYIRGRE